MANYGTFERDRANAIQFVFDVRDNGCRLKSGGEQYPNAICAADLGHSLVVSCNKNFGSDRKEELSSSLFLGFLLIGIWDYWLDPSEPEDMMWLIFAAEDAMGHVDVRFSGASAA